MTLALDVESVSEARRDLSRAYVGGGPGVVVSGLAWLAAALVLQAHGVRAGFLTLYAGGVAIHPLTKLLRVAVFRRGREAAANPFRATVLESLAALLGGLLAAWLILPYRPELVFPMAAVAVGARYFLFRTVFGDRAFWALGAGLVAVGWSGVFAGASGVAIPLLVSLAELAFGVALTWRALRRERRLSAGG